MSVRELNYEKAGIFFTYSSLGEMKILMLFVIKDFLM